MKKPIRYEYVATRGKDGSYECHDSPVRVQADSNSEIDAVAQKKAAIAEKLKTESDINRVFFDSYESNFTATSSFLLKENSLFMQERRSFINEGYSFLKESNDLLKQAQENLIEMQKRILDSIKQQ